MKERSKPELGRQRATPEAAEDAAPDVRVRALRCPFCHEGCGAEDSVVCRSCTARHHTACWDEGGACSACGSGTRMVAEQPVERSSAELLEWLEGGDSAAVLGYHRSRGHAADEALRLTADMAFTELAARGRSSGQRSARAWIYGLQATLLAVLAFAVLSRSAEACSQAGGAVMGLTSVAAIAMRLRLGPRGRTFWREQLGLTLSGTIALAVLVTSFSIPGSRGSILLAFLGGILAACSLRMAKGEPPISGPRAPGPEA